MNIKEILTGQEKDKLFLMGNEAAVRGALEAGVSVLTTQGCILSFQSMKK